MKLENPKQNIADLEQILRRGDGETIEILPDGTIKETGVTPTRKPLTMREDLGSEYADPFMDCYQFGKR